MSGVLGHGFEHIGNERQHNVLVDTVLCGAELSNRDFAVLRTGILRNALAVVDAVNIHLPAAIGAVKQAREGCGFAPAVRAASDVSPDFLHKVKGFLVNDGFMGVFKNCPLVLRDIMAFLVLEMLAGLKVAGMSQIFPLFQNVYNGR